MNPVPSPGFIHKHHIHAGKVFALPLAPAALGHYIAAQITPTSSEITPAACVHRRQSTRVRVSSESGPPENQAGCKSVVDLGEIAGRCRNGLDR
jgi:hypothetical protein